MMIAANVATSRPLVIAIDRLFPDGVAPWL